MASFFEKNKRKSALALLLLFLKWRKGLAPLLLIVMLLMLMSFAPGNLMGICLAGLSKIPGGAHFAAAVTYTASKAGLEIGGVPRQGSYRDYVAAFKLAGDQGFAGLLQKRSFKDLIDAFKTARYDRSAAMALLFHNNAQGGGPRGGGSGMDWVKGDLAGGAGGGAMAGKIAQNGGKSVSGVMNPDDAKDLPNGVSLDEADLEGERAGMVQSAFGQGLDLDKALGGSGAYASKAFFGAAGDMGRAGAMGPAGKKGANGSKISRFAMGNSAKGGGARLGQTSRRGGGSMNLGRRGMRYSKAMGTLRGMASLNGQVRNATTTEEASGGATEQWEGSPLTGSQAQLPATPPAIDGGGHGGGFGGIPGGYPGGSYPTGGNYPTYVPGDPGIVCTSAQLAQGMVSDGTTCTQKINVNAGQDAAGWESDMQSIGTDIFAALGLFAATAGLVGGGMDLIKTGSSCLIIAGVALLIAGIGTFIAGLATCIDGISKSADLMSHGAGFEGVMLMAALVTEIIMGVYVFACSLGGIMAAMSAIGSTGVVIGALFAALMGGVMLLVGGAAPQTPQVDNPIDDQREKDAGLNAQTGGGDTGLPPAPPDMHYETGPDGQQHLEYNYNTFPPGQEPPPSVEQQLNKQKGGGDSGLPPAPAGMHYEGTNSDGTPKLVHDYPIGVAQREDANSFTGGPPTQLPPAPSGQHYEEKNNGGDPTDPKNWQLVDNYQISNSDIKAANSNKGQPGSEAAYEKCPPAKDGYHYEGHGCNQVKDYPTN